MHPRCTHPLHASGTHIRHIHRHTHPLHPLRPVLLEGDVALEATAVHDVTGTATLLVYRGDVKRIFDMSFSLDWKVRRLHAA